jgi:hypothetical protein
VLSGGHQTHRTIAHRADYSKALRSMLDRVTGIRDDEWKTAVGLRGQVDRAAVVRLAAEQSREWHGPTTREVNDGVYGALCSTDYSMTGLARLRWFTGVVNRLADWVGSVQGGCLRSSRRERGPFRIGVSGESHQQNERYERLFLVDRYVRPVRGIVTPVLQQLGVCGECVADPLRLLPK